MKGQIAASRIVWFAFATMLLSGCSSENETPATEPSSSAPAPGPTVDAGNAEWAPIGAYPYVNWEVSLDGNWVITSVVGDHSIDLLRAYQDAATGALAVANDAGTMVLADAAIVSYSVAADGDELIETVEFAG